jgi:hypothetical protein
VRVGPFIALGVVILAAGCSDDSNDGPAAPDRLYLALLDSELTVQLVEEEPEPY